MSGIRPQRVSERPVSSSRDVGRNHAGILSVLVGWAVVLVEGSKYAVGFCYTLS
jgi:hypothetical protein